jgi:putative spermidine/putrescine transport system ATP-binding protein
MSERPAGTATRQAAHIRLEGITKQFGPQRVVDGIDLAVARGEVLVLLGPSGCGKSTTLRMIAGLERPDAGRIVLHDQDVTDWPAEARQMGMVFQQYALFPNMNVFENVAFGLKIRGASREEQRARVGEMLGMLQIGELASRMASELSGGQQQRVALGRALAIRPEVLLLDEPLTALDAKLREELRAELARLLGELKITTVYVTHDQAEGMALGRRIAIMHRGRIVQLAAPADIYHRPVNRFVAGFVGTSNIFPGRVVATSGAECEVGWEGGRVQARGEVGCLEPGAEVSLLVRPEEMLLLAPDATQPGACPATVENALFLGDRTRVYARTPGGLRFIVDVVGDVHAAARDLRIAFRPASAYILREEETAPPEEKEAP